MSGYRLDTNAAPSALTLPDRLPPRRASGDPRRPEYAERGFVWEVPLKSMKGNLRVGDPRAWWHDALEQLAAAPLALRPDHVAAIHALPAIHKDPFDRVPITQAAVEDLEIATLDSEIPLYASGRLRVVA